VSTATKETTGQDVVSAMMTMGTPAQKARATKLQKEYVARRASEGKNPKKVLAGLLSRVSRLQNEKKVKAKPAAAPKKAVKTAAAAKPKKK